MILPDKIKHLKTRVCFVPNCGPFTIPRYIVRIDIAQSNTHGWQDRFNKPWVFFSDKGIGPDLSLMNAINHLAEQWKERPIKIKVRENKNKHIPVGIRGVRIGKYQKKGRNVEELYAEAIPVKYGQSTKRFYIGTANTATVERMDIAIKKAKKQRYLFELEHLAFRKES